MAHSPFDHVKDASYFETSPTLGIGWEEHGHFGIHLPEIPWLPSLTKVVAKLSGEPVDSVMGFQVTKFMVLQLLAFSIVGLVMWGLSRRVAKGDPVRGRFWNFWETLVMFIRNEVVRPTIGDGHHHDEHDHAHGHDPHTDPDAAMDQLAEHGSGPVDDVLLDGGPAEGGPHPADKYLPFVATLFFYILTCNLLGMVPWLGSPTGDISVTAALAVCTFVAVVAFGISEMGAAKFAGNFCPSGVPGFLVPVIWAIEVFGMFIKHFVLAVRLFANMMAGHVVLAVFLLFIYQFAVNETTHASLSFGEVPTLYWIVMPASIFGQVAISLLELFVAFLQSYIFAFLATLFIASVVHEH